MFTKICLYLIYIFFFMSIWVKSFIVFLGLTWVDISFSVLGIGSLCRSLLYSGLSVRMCFKVIGVRQPVRFVGSSPVSICLYVSLVSINVIKIVSVKPFHSVHGTVMKYSDYGICDRRIE